MSKKLIILLVLLGILIVSSPFLFMFYRSMLPPENREDLLEQGKLGSNGQLLVRQCPTRILIDEINPEGDLKTSYLIDGYKRDISEFDVEWINANCDLTNKTLRSKYMPPK
jgi:hypothetical protein